MYARRDTRLAWVDAVESRQSAVASERSGIFQIADMAITIAIFPQIALWLPNKLIG